tara:strand:+ start:171 stop:869 length:699 start_codon:yes stop_codon:yes gene_type:complete
MYSIILPIYNERENLDELIPKLFKNFPEIDLEIIVVDDDSNDGTGKVVNVMKEKFTNLVYKNRKGETRSLGKSVLDGVKLSKYENLILMDSDFSHSVEDVKKMIFFQNNNNYDLICYSRFAEIKPDLFNLRYSLSKIYNYFLKPFLGLKTSDSLSGFFLIKKKLIQNLPQNKVFYGYGDYYFRLLFYIKKNNLKFKEMSFSWVNRKYGKSKTKFFNIFARYSYEAIKLRIGL